MDKTFCCSCCGLQKSLNGKKLQEIALHCSHCGRAVKHWSCHRHRCEVLIWAKARRNYVCTKCTKLELKVACESNNISMLALALSLELHYKCKRRMVPDEEGEKLIELWRKARNTGTEFARAAAKEAVAIAYRASETADFILSASERAENAARNMMAELARHQSRARASSSVPGITPHASSNSNLTHRRPNRVQQPLFTSSLTVNAFSSTRNSPSRDQPPLFTSSLMENAFARTRNYPMQQHPKLKESIGSRMKSCEPKALIRSHRSRRRRGINSSKQIRPLLCGCRCQ